MDKWEEMMKKFMAKPEAERMKQLDQSKTMCICTNCPSYRGTGETELLFCGIGKSSIIKEEKECSCGLCPVVAHMGLTRLYYCTRGSEREQRGISVYIQTTLTKIHFSFFRSPSICISRTMSYTQES